jgi:hypothetical protein
MDPLGRGFVIDTIVNLLSDTMKAMKLVESVVDEDYDDYDDDDCYDDYDYWYDDDDY